MAAPDTIRPIDDSIFQLEVYNQAHTKARHDPASLTTLELRHLACYDPEGAEDAARRGAEILAARATEVQQRATQEREARERQAQRHKALEARQQRDERREEARRRRAAEPRIPTFLPPVTYDRAEFDRCLQLVDDNPDMLTAKDISHLCVVDPWFLGFVERSREHAQLRREWAADDGDDETDPHDHVKVTWRVLKRFASDMIKDISHNYNPIFDRTTDRITSAMLRIMELEQRAGGAETTASREARDEQAFTILQLKARIETLEARPTLEYQGVWKSQPYPRGAAVTHGGSLWVAERDTDRQPSIAAPETTGWRLAVKKGADGKDFRP